MTEDLPGQGHILMAVTSHARLGGTGRSTGLWLEELAAPYYLFTDAGFAVTIASPLGGLPPVDEGSRRGAVIATVCHGAAGLLSAAAEGSLVKGRTLTGFSDDEEAALSPKSSRSSCRRASRRREPQ
jgi:putative intracellular protease/amidase